MSQYLQCTDVGVPSPLCQVKTQSIYGYYPNLGANAFFCAFFGIACAIQLAQGIRWKSWTFATALVLGCLAEAIGYVGRILLHSNPFQSTGFNIQISLLIIAPAFLSAGVYLTLKHLTLALGPSFSRIQPRFYTWIFITCDIFSLVLQAAGGGIAASAKGVKSKQESGADLMMAGIVWQVFTLLVFALLAGDYFVKVYQNRTRLSPAATSLLHETRFRLFLGGLVFAFLAIFTRCAYRIAELSHGWKSPIMQNEVDFIVLDGTMVALAVLSLTVFHPGWSFPLMQMQNKNFAGANANGKHIADSRDGDLEAMAL